MKHLFSKLLTLILKLIMSTKPPDTDEDERQPALPDRQTAEKSLQLLDGVAAGMNGSRREHEQVLGAVENLRAVIAHAYRPGCEKDAPDHATPPIVSDPHPRPEPNPPVVPPDVPPGRDDNPPEPGSKNA